LTLCNQCKQEQPGARARRAYLQRMTENAGAKTRMAQARIIREPEKDASVLPQQSAALRSGIGNSTI
jgi:hypothetical protein